MRFAHYLRQNEQDEVPSQFVCVDTETRPDKQADGSEVDRLWFGWACYQRARDRGHWCEPVWFRFETRAQFWKWLVAWMRPQTTLYAFNHNTSFDLPVLGAFTMARRYRLSLKMAIIDAPPTILKWRKGKSTLKWLDTLNFWRVPLVTLGEKIGAPKLPMPGESASSEVWDTYCKNDVEVIRRALIGWWGFLTSERLGNFRPTLASQALGTFKHRFMPERMLVHTNAPVLKLERAAYHGGRCDCFFVGRKRGRFYLLDVNSMYPAVMKSNAFPTRFLWEHRSPSLAGLQRALAHNLVLADVSIETGTPAYPLVFGGKLNFPVGKFRTVLTTPEVEFALGRGEVKHVHRLVEYVGTHCFGGFVDYFYSRRGEAIRAGNAPLSYQYKILMNSLYGKFGQTGRVWQKHAHTRETCSKVWAVVNVDKGQVTRFRQLAGLIQSYQEEDESAESMPVMAAHVTAHARLLLWRYIEQAGRHHVYYCDTDSILVDRRGRENLSAFIDTERLGGLKIEGKYNEIEIWGPKDYRFGDKIRHKGIRANADQLASNQWKQWQWSSLVGLLRAGQLDTPKRTPVTKTLKRIYDKGTIDAKNWVNPLRINEDT